MDFAFDPSRPHPFAHDVDPDAFYRSPIHESVRAALVTTAKTHTGFLALLGEPGTGKTAVLQRVARDLEHGAIRVLRASALRPPHEMFLPVDGEPGPRGAATPTTWGASFFTTLRARVRAEGATVVAVDDAQRLTLTELRFVRDLAEAERASQRRLAILLVGQPSLDAKLARLEEERGEPAFTVRVRLGPLDPSDVGAYMAGRLQRQGLRLDDVFTADAVDRVTAHARGLPRLINQLCYAALHTATEAGLATVSASSIETAAGRLELDVDRDQPQPTGRGTPPRMGTWAHRAASARARMEPAARGVGAMLIVAGLAIVRGVGAGARGLASAVTMLGTAVASLGELAAVAPHGVRRATRAGPHAVTAAVRGLGAAVVSLGTLMAATARGVGRGVSAGVHALAVAGATLWAWIGRVGRTVAPARRRPGREVRTSLRGLTAAGATIGTRAGKATASVAAARRAASRRAAAWVSHQAASIIPKVRALPSGVVFTVLSLAMVTLVLALWPISHEPPSIERPPPSGIVESLERTPDAERAHAPRAVSPGGTRRRESLRSPAPPARGPVTFTTARPPSDR